MLSDTVAFQAYRRKSAFEQFNCSYGLNTDHRNEIEDSELNMSGVDDNGEARIGELPNHRFFVAALFLPQLASSPEEPQPSIIDFLKAARSLKSEFVRRIHAATAVPNDPVGQ
ncbi:MAG: hypothetical protein GY866_35540 [Proteobacteria bacterium]|nr:hypothetical protein [Pseudomonadota bacterium]